MTFPQPADIDIKLLVGGLIVRFSAKQKDCCFLKAISCSVFEPLEAFCRVYTYPNVSTGICPGHLKLISGGSIDTMFKMRVRVIEKTHAMEPVYRLSIVFLYSFAPIGIKLTYHLLSILIAKPGKWLEIFQCQSTMTRLHCNSPSIP